MDVEHITLQMGGGGIQLEKPGQQDQFRPMIDDQLIEPSLHIWALRIINISEQVKKLADWPK